MSHKFICKMKRHLISSTYSSDMRPEKLTGQYIGMMPNVQLFAHCCFLSAVVSEYIQTSINKLFIV